GDVAVQHGEVELAVAVKIARHQLANGDGIADVKYLAGLEGAVAEIHAYLEGAIRAQIETREVDRTVVIGSGRHHLAEVDLVEGDGVPKGAVTVVDQEMRSAANRHEVGLAVAGEVAGGHFEGPLAGGVSRGRGEGAVAVVQEHAHGVAAGRHHG